MEPNNTPTPNTGTVEIKAVPVLTGYLNVSIKEYEEMKAQGILMEVKEVKEALATQKSTPNTELDMTNTRTCTDGHTMTGIGGDCCPECEAPWVAPSQVTGGMEERFDAQFPFRIYGIAGEPKTEFVHTVNMPDKVKDFIRQELATQKSQLIAEVEAERLENTKDETTSDWFYGYGWNTALDAVITKLKEM